VIDEAKILELLNAHDAGGLLLVDERLNVLTIDGNERTLIRELLRLAHIGAVAEFVRDERPDHVSYAIPDLFRRHADRWPRVTP
jgi:hypothetical protein